jgi:hypothetical protein
VLTDTKAEVATGEVTEASRRGLEVDGALPAGEVGAGKISGSTDKLGHGGSNGIENVLRELARSNGGLSGLEGGEVLLPALGELSLETALELSSLLGVLLSVLGEEGVPLVVLLDTLGGLALVESLDVVGDNEGLLGVEAELGLELLDVVGLERSTVDVVATLLERTETNGGLEVDEGRLGLLVTSLGKSTGNGVEVLVTGSDVENVPTVSAEAALNVLSERDIGRAVNGDRVVVPDGNQVVELEVTVSVRTCPGLGHRATHPASEQASEATPSWRQPSPRKAEMLAKRN